jgi:H+/Cl- antiporter ClcA
MIILLLMAAPVLTLWALIDLLRRPATDWSTSGQDRTVWALVVILVAVVGPALYLTLGRSKLVDASGDGNPAVIS